MDPLTTITAALQLATIILDFAKDIYKDTPKEIREANAANWGTFVHNTGDVILDWQKKLNALIK